MMFTDVASNVRLLKSSKPSAAAKFDSARIVRVLPLALLGLKTTVKVTRSGSLNCKRCEAKSIIFASVAGALLELPLTIAKRPAS